MDAVAGGAVRLLFTRRADGAALVPGSGEAQGGHPGRRRVHGAGIRARVRGRVGAVGARGGGARGARVLLQPDGAQFRRCSIPLDDRPAIPPPRYGIAVRSEGHVARTLAAQLGHPERRRGLRRRRSRQAAALVLRPDASRRVSRRHAPEPAVRPGLGRQLGIRARRGEVANVPARGGVRPDGERVDSRDDGCRRGTERGERAGVRDRVSVHPRKRFWQSSAQAAQEPDGAVAAGQGRGESLPVTAGTVREGARGGQVRPGLVRGGPRV